MSVKKKKEKRNNVIIVNLNIPHASVSIIFNLHHEIGLIEKKKRKEKSSLQCVCFYGLRTVNAQKDEPFRT